jgi:hypothetical protein
VAIRALIRCSIVLAFLSLTLPVVHAQIPTGPPPAPAAPAPVPATGTTQTQTVSTTSTNPASPAPSVSASKDAKAATDAVAKEESTIASSANPRESADQYTKSILDITGAVSARTATPIDDFHTLQKMIAAVQQSNLLDVLTKAKASLAASPPGASAPATLEDTRAALCAKLSQYDNLQQQDVTDAESKCSDAKEKAANAVTALGTSLGHLQSALGGIYAYVANQVSALNDRLKPLKSLQPGADPAPLLQALPGGLAALKSVLGDQQQFDTAWKSTKPLLTQLGIPVPPAPAGGTAPDVEKQFTDLQSTIDSILPNFDGWFKKITDSLTTAAKSLDSTISDVATDPAKNSAAAVGAIRDENNTLGNVQPVVDAWPPLVGFLTDGKPAGFNLKTTITDFGTMETAENVLRGSISRMQDALAGDMQDFDTDQVSLYYFTDVSRLMYALNESTQTVGGVADAQAKAAAQRTTLMQAELDLADAQATVNQYQKQVLDLEEQQRQLNAKLNFQDSVLTSLTSRSNAAQANKTDADTTLQNARNDTGNPSQASEISRATAAQTSAATKVSQAQSNVDNAKTQRDATQSQLNDSQNQSDSLPAKIDAARQSLSQAQTAVSQERRKMLMAAQAESDAFAFARDNAPFLYAPAVASSSDSAKRVILYAFNDSKTIFMRGKPDDLTLVKQIIAEFDRPAPQARLTIWTFQLSSESDQKTNVKAAKKLNDSMAIIDQELGDARALVNTATALLRDLINEQVRAHTALPATFHCSDGTPTAPDLEKLGRLSFFDPLVLKQLNFDVTKFKLRELRKLLPDPAGTTTLGEALMVLSLSTPDIKRQVRTEFETRIRGRLQALSLSPEYLKIDTSWRNLPAEAAFLQLTWHALGIWEPDAVGTTAGLTSSQLEICRALRTAYDSARLRQFADLLGSWSIEWNSISGRLSELQIRLAKVEDSGRTTLSDADRSQLSALQQKSNRTGPEQAQLNNLVAKSIRGLPQADAVTYDMMDSERLQLDARRRTISHKSVSAVKELRDVYGVDVGDLQALSQNPAKTELESFHQELSTAKLLALKSPGLNGTSPRVAAADQMLKELVIAIEDDLSRLFIQPMIEKLRMRLTSQAGVNVGILQRESLLTTNRGKARIDPRASAQLSVGTETDILSGVQQLAQLYMVAQSGGALGFLGALQAQPREQQPQIIALATGDQFEVTPVFDPSGQALRFKFDHVSTTVIQEPNGTTDPQLPQIDRHTVNTEVQLSNLETREISRFEVNARLGRPTEYWGGFPIFKDIPGFRPWVPLLGWFVRKAGSNAVAQQSVIFGQTTMYPTIGAIVDLLSDQGGADSTSPKNNEESKPPGDKQ